MFTDHCLLYLIDMLLRFALRSPRRPFSLGPIPSLILRDSIIPFWICLKTLKKEKKSMIF